MSESKFMKELEELENNRKGLASYTEEQTKKKEKDEETETVKKKKFEFNVAEPEKFNSVEESIYMKSSKLTNQIGLMLKEVFEDFCDIVLEYDPTIQAPHSNVAIWARFRMVTNQEYEMKGSKKTRLIISQFENEEETVPNEVKNMINTMKKISTFNNNPDYSKYVKLSELGRDKLKSITMFNNNKQKFVAIDRPGQPYNATNGGNYFVRTVNVPSSQYPGVVTNVTTLFVSVRLDTNTIVKKFFNGRDLDGKLDKKYKYRTYYIAESNGTDKLLKITRINQDEVYKYGNEGIGFMY